MFHDGVWRRNDVTCAYALEVLLSVRWLMRQSPVPPDSATLETLQRVDTSIDNPCAAIIACASCHDTVLFRVCWLLAQLQLTDVPTARISMALFAQFAYDDAAIAEIISSGEYSQCTPLRWFRPHETGTVPCRRRGVFAMHVNAPGAARDAVGCC